MKTIGVRELRPQVSEYLKAVEAGGSFEITAQGRLKELGLTELVFETDEPEPAEVLALFPAGNYRFEGRTLDQEKLVGAATLSHSLPPAPVF